MPPVLLIATVPISIAGWGVRESGMIAAFAYAGLAESDGLMLSILFGAAILTLAAGTGLATGVLAVAYGVLLRPLPFPDADRIVLVITASAHRQAAFEANMFLVDWLKTKAPFWKVEDTPKGEQWVGAHEGDDQAARKWER